MNIYVGNMPYSTSEEELSALFGTHGNVSRIHIVMDRDTGRAKGFAFVEMPNDAEARAALEALNGSPMGGRALVVTEARPREEKPRGERRPFGNRGGDRGPRGPRNEGNM